MKEFTIKKEEEGQKLLRFLEKVLKNANMSFLYKMLRKKNIVLNGKKATGNEKLQSGDSIKIFFSDDTFEKMAGSVKTDVSISQFPKAPFPLEIVYEDENLICVNKPFGALSQKDDTSHPSMNEYLIRYLLDNNQLELEDLNRFRPSVVNRLDRNTSGILLFGKTMAGLHAGSDLMKSHSGNKTYHCIVTGDTKKFTEKTIIKGYLKKNSGKNIVTFYKQKKPNSLYMEEEVLLLDQSGNYSLLEVVLYTGRSHQIRSSLAFYGCPIVNDKKYGGKLLPNERIGQYLHASSIQLTDNTLVTCPDPVEFDDLMKKKRG